MSLSITNDSKNALSVSNESKDNDLTWEEATHSLADSSPRTWQSPGVPFAKDSKNALSISNESKL